MKTKWKTFGALPIEYILYTKEPGGLKKIYSPFGPTNPHLSCLSLKTISPKIRFDSECVTLKLWAVLKKETIPSVRKTYIQQPHLYTHPRFRVSFFKDI